ncbi:SMP-30/gluconolactonase/LRE family protein [Paraphotobacterium marinum]|nr:SMP-30/gluconolactonase/LRE family protein [Paraphotobacterium marinum]
MLKSLMYVVFCFFVSLFSNFLFAKSFVHQNPTIINGNFGFVEGPVWDKKNKRFLFSDIPNNKIYALNPKTKKLSIYDENSGYANGLDFDKQRNLWSARHDRKLSYQNEGGKKIIVASLFNGKLLNSPNDLAIKSDGSIWFTDPPFGIQGYGPKKAKSEQGFNGVYRYKNGNLSLVTSELKIPNGIAFSLDESKLYVADSSNGWVYQFDIHGKKVTNKLKFVQVTGSKGSKPFVDGIAIDAHDNLFAATTGGVRIFNKKGQKLDFIKIKAKHVSNIAFGGSDNKLLLVTAFDKIYLYKML